MINYWYKYPALVIGKKAKIQHLIFNLEGNTNVQLSVKSEKCIKIVIHTRTFDHIWERTVYQLEQIYTTKTHSLKYKSTMDKQ
jgi:hypothetical protein